MVSVANFPFNRFTPNCRSVLYLLLIDKSADLVPLWVVTFKVCLALSSPIPNVSASTSADILICLSVEVYVYLVGRSSSVSSYLATSATYLGTSAAIFSFRSGVGSVDTAYTISLILTSARFHSVLLVIWIWGQSCNSSLVGALDSNRILVP